MYVNIRAHTHYYYHEKEGIVKNNNSAFSIADILGSFGYLDFAWLATQFVDQPGLEIVVIPLSLLPQCNGYRYLPLLLG